MESAQTTAPNLTSTRRGNTSAESGQSKRRSKRKENVRSPAEAKRFNFVKNKFAEKKRRQILVDVPKDRDGSLAAMERFTVAYEADAEKGLSKKLRGLEGLVEGFRGKVDEIVQQFDELKADIEELTSRYDAVEQDYHTAMGALEEEKETVSKYEGFLKNAELENELLRRVIPAEDLQYEAAFSQARPW